MSVEADSVVVDFSVDGPVATITLNRPEQRNRWNRALWHGLLEALDRLGRDRELRVGILTGAGAVFSAGADLSDPAVHSTEDISEYDEGQDNSLYDALQRCIKPVVAAIHGSAHGAGATLALACDLRVMADDAYLVWPMARLGMIPANGTLVRMARLVGAGNALDITMTAREIHAGEAYRMGLVNRVVPAARLMAEARDLAGALAQNAPLSLRFIKESLYRGLDMGLHDAIHAERYRQFILYGTDDRKEASKAWLERRPPKFTGR
jgi:enoyl-CoA hydratase/carnithine racemase